ncbi:MAG: PIN domain-containing protein [Candidatus Omnitrophota bacterium]|nr:PIN domain-containing protein [Candidatus Omnitrophota bacterium]
MRIYIDTSVINGFYAKDERIKDITKQFFHSVKFGRFTLYGSEIVSTEIKNTPHLEKRKLLIEVIEEYPIEILPVTEEVETLARNYIENKIIPAKYIADALHIACCVIHNIPILVSWNFEHIVKHKTRMEVNKISQKLGFPQIDLCSPEEV